MNLVLLFPQDFISPTRVRLDGRRLAHIRGILKSKVGDMLTMGCVNGCMGQGTILDISPHEVHMEVSLSQKPPEPLPLTLIMPMVRPVMFKRMLFTAVTLGIKRIYVLHFSKVDKSLWSSRSLDTEAIQEQCHLGLEQAKDTVMPSIDIRPQFKPFVDDELPSLSKGSKKIVAHPGQGEALAAYASPITMVIGPEGGLTSYEIALLINQGFSSISLGPRIFRVDTALVYAVSQLNK